MEIEDYVVTEDRFLDVNYIENRLLCIPKIQDGSVSYMIRKSNNAISKSIYVVFYGKAPSGAWNKNYSLRISDHYKKVAYGSCFLIKPNKELTQARIDEFCRTLKDAVRYSNIKRCRYLIKTMKKELEMIEEEFKNLF